MRKDRLLTTIIALGYSYVTDTCDSTLKVPCESIVDLKLITAILYRLGYQKDEYNLILASTDYNDCEDHFSINFKD